MLLIRALPLEDDIERVTKLTRKSEAAAVAHVLDGPEVNGDGRRI